MQSETGNKSSQATMAEVDLHSAAQPTSAGEPPPNPTAPYPTAQPTFVGEPPPPYSTVVGSTRGEEITFAEEPPASSASSTHVVPQYPVPSSENPTQHTAVGVVSSQPRSYLSSQVTPVAGYIYPTPAPDHKLLAVSVCLCILCFFCGTPFTFFIFLNAIRLAKKVCKNNYYY